MMRIPIAQDGLLGWRTTEYTATRPTVSLALRLFWKATESQTISATLSFFINGKQFLHPSITGDLANKGTFFRQRRGSGALTRALFKEGGVNSRASSFRDKIRHR